MLRASRTHSGVQDSWLLIVFDDVLDINKDEMMVVYVQVTTGASATLTLTFITSSRSHLNMSDFEGSDLTDLEDETYTQQSSSSQKKKKQKQPGEAYRVRGALRAPRSTTISASSLLGTKLAIPVVKTKTILILEQNNYMRTISTWMRNINEARRA